ncbi:hypothetical protein KAH55_09800, partial [bacterium]|nr:hypothetical protein [bacterium]
MSKLSRQKRFLFAEPLPHLQRPKARLQPFLAKPGEPSVDIYELEKRIGAVADVNPMIVVESPEQWANAVRSLGPEVDGILPFSIPAYPTEIWNSHPQPLVDRNLPFIFWCLLDHQEPDFWRWSAKDFLTALGVDVQLVNNDKEGLALLKALAMKRFLQNSKLVVFGEQNFPWNATAGGHLVTEKLGTKILVRPMSDIREQYPDISDAAVETVLAQRLGERYVVDRVLPEELEQAVRTYLAIKNILEAEKALGFGVNCFGDLIPNGDRDVPCLAQSLLREDGYIAACDGDYIAMMSMVLSTFFLDKTTMMSNMYPVSYVGAL